MKTRRTVEIENSVLGKAFFIFIVLLIVSFGFGLYLGKESGTTQPLDTSEKAVKEQLNACSYKIQELTQKFSALQKHAVKNGLLDNNGTIVDDIKCVVVQKPEDKSSSKPQHARKPDDSNDKKAADSKTKKKRQYKKSTNTEIAQKKKESPHQKRTKRNIKADSEKDNLWDEIDNLSISDTVEKKPVEKTCKYAIQIYAGRSRAEAMKAKRRSPLQNTRMVKGVVKGTTWFRIRYGCYYSKIDAAAALTEVQEIVKNPLIVVE